MDEWYSMNNWTYCAKRTDLAPDQHGAKYDLQAIKEVIPNDDNSGSSCGPALTGTDGFNAGCGCFHNGTERDRRREIFDFI